MKLTDDKLDEILGLYIEMVTQEILNYCNIKELPEDLKFVAAMMVVDMYKDLSGTNGTSGPVSSVSEAGRSVSFDSSQATMATEQRINARRTQLDRFKQVYAFR